jgi:hypothetical protein
MKKVDDLLVPEPAAFVMPAPVGIEPEDGIFLWNDNFCGCKPDGF